MTGRAAVIKRLLTIVERVDNAGDRSVVTVPLSWASAAEVVKLVTELNKDSSKSALPGSMVANVVADERTNAVLVSGEPNSRQRIIAMIKQLDRQQAVQGNTKVIYLKYAKAADLVEVLTGISSSLQNDKQSAKPVAAIDKNIIIKAHGQTNALIVTAAPDVMNDLERVIAQLDIRRPQVLVEAIIAEVQDADGLNLGIQWTNTTKTVPPAARWPALWARLTVSPPASIRGTGRCCSPPSPAVPRTIFWPPPASSPSTTCKPPLTSARKFRY